MYAHDPARLLRQRPGCTSRPTCSTRSLGAGVALARVELVVGLDTFQPVSEDDPTRHRIHSERYRVPPATLEACRHATPGGCGRNDRGPGPRVRRGSALPRAGRALFIHRPYEWQLVDLMLTNFHLPRTTLLMMIDAFVGSRWRDLYAMALADGYRFLSFGDAMLLQRGARMTAPVRFEVEAADGPARAGIAHAARGSYRTPCFMPVGTRGAVQATCPRPTWRTSAREIVLGNTYHLMLRPGAATIVDLGGLGRFTAGTA